MRRHKEHFPRMNACVVWVAKRCMSLMRMSEVEFGGVAEILGAMRQECGLELGQGWFLCRIMFYEGESCFELLDSLSFLLIVNEFKMA